MLHAACNYELKKEYNELVMKHLNKDKKKQGGASASSDSDKPGLKRKHSRSNSADNAGKNGKNKQKSSKTNVEEIDFSLPFVCPKIELDEPPEFNYDHTWSESKPWKRPRHLIRLKVEVEEEKVEKFKKEEERGDISETESDEKSEVSPAIKRKKPNNLTAQPEKKMEKKKKLKKDSKRAKRTSGGKKGSKKKDKKENFVRMTDDEELIESIDFTVKKLNYLYLRRRLLELQKQKSALKRATPITSVGDSHNSAQVQAAGASTPGGFFKTPQASSIARSSVSFPEPQSLFPK